MQMAAGTWSEKGRVKTDRSNLVISEQYLSNVMHWRRLLTGEKLSTLILPSTGIVFTHLCLSVIRICVD